MKLIQLILIYSVVNSCKLQIIETEVDDYIKIILAYFRARNVRILTHFTCFPTSMYKNQD